MADVVVGAKIQIDSGNVGPTIKEVKENIKQLKTELDGAKVGSEQHRMALEKLKTANEQLNPTLVNQKKGIGGVTDSLKNSVPGFAGAAQGAQGLGAAFKALIANPIGLVIAAIVLGLKFLYEAFTSTSEGGKKVEQVFAGVKAAAQVVIDRVFALGNAVIKFFSGDFKGAVNDAKAAVTGIGAAIADQYNKVAGLTKQAQELAKEQRQNDLEQVERQAKLAKLREQAYDDSVPKAKRKAALLELKKESEQNAKEDLDLAKRTADNKIALLSQGKDGEKKNADEINQIKIEQRRGEIENANELRAIGKQVTAMDKQEAAERKANQQAAAAAAKEARQKAIEEEKQQRANLKAYTEKLTNLEHENTLAGIKDVTQKKLLELKYAHDAEVAIINEDFLTKKINKQQHDKLIEALEQGHHHKMREIEQAAAAEAEKTRQETQARILKEEEDKRVKQRDENLKGEVKKVDGLVKDGKLEAARMELDALAAMRQYYYEQDKIAAAGNVDALAAIEARRTDDLAQQTETRKQISDAEFENKQRMVSAVSGILSAATSLIGEQTGVGKGIAVAGAVIDTYASISKTLKAFAGVPVPGYAIAQAIGMGIAGFANVKKILSVQVPKSSGGGSAGGSISMPSMPTVSTAAPLSPTATGTRLDQDTINGIGNAAGNRAFVLENDVTNSRERIERLNRAAQLN